MRNADICHIFGIFSWKNLKLLVTFTWQFMLFNIGFKGNKIFLHCTVHLDLLSKIASQQMWVEKKCLTKHIKIISFVTGLKRFKPHNIFEWHVLVFALSILNLCWLISKINFGNIQTTRPPAQDIFWFNLFVFVLGSFHNE